LLVEDSQPDAELIEQVLGSMRHSVTTHRVDTRDAFALALKEFQPDLVLCDHSGGSFPTRAVMDVLRSARPGTPLIVVSAAVDERMTVGAIRAGAEDVVPKSRLDRLPASITLALAVRKRVAQLTPRQLQVWRLVAEGFTTPDLARRLRISPKTADVHRGQLMKRLGIHDVANLTRLATRIGIVVADATPPGGFDLR
jgi:DNA-binding NarL/FixJ family response regulator